MARDLGDVLEAILAGVIVLDAEGCVEELNGAACRILESSKPQVLGAPAERLVTPDHALARLARQTLASGTSTSQADQAVERRGQAPALVDVTASPLFDADGVIDGVVVVMRDRSGQRRLEQLEVERQRFASFGRIAAGLAHEIKNPLGGIRGAGELLSRRAESDKARETAELVVREATRIASLVEDFNVFARGESLRLVPTNVHRVLDDVLDLLSLDPLAQSVTVAREFDPSIPELLADPDRLTQVFLNLARNALQAMHGRDENEAAASVLRIRTRMSLHHRIAIEPGRPVPTLAVEIADTGCGMDEDERRQATTPFFTRRSGGTGLGLAVADYWISKHHGTLEIQSTRGEGTLIRVALPMRRDTPVEETR